MKISIKKAMVVFFVLTFLVFSINSHEKLNVNAYVGANNVYNKLLDGTDSLHNLVLVLNFENEDPLDQENIQLLNEIYNESDYSLSEFIEVQSNASLEVNSTIIDNIYIDMPLSYFMPKYEYNEWSKSYSPTKYQDGYNNKMYKNGEEVAPTEPGAVSHIDAVFREQKLIRLAISRLTELYPTIPQDLDNNGDGIIDSVTMVTGGYSDSSWGGVIYPHASVFYEGNMKELTSYYFEDSYFEGQNKLDCVEIYGKQLLDYIIIPFDNFTIDREIINYGLASHEFMHVIGIPDYYSYEGVDEEWVNYLDIMSLTLPKPQLSLTYVREYMGWVDQDSVVAVDKSGEYTLSPTTTNNGVMALKIVPNDYLEHGDYFYVEYRKTDGVFDEFKQIVNTNGGVICYRVNEANGYLQPNNEFGYTNCGNMYGEPEIEVFYDALNLMNRQNYFVNGSMSRLGDVTGGDKNLIRLSNGDNSKIEINFVSNNSDGTITIDVEIPEALESDIKPTNNYPNVSEKQYGGVKIEWNSTARVGQAKVIVSQTEIENIDYSHFKKATIVPISYKEYSITGLDNAYVYIYFEDANTKTEIYSLEYKSNYYKYSQIVDKIVAFVIIATIAFLIFAVLISFKIKKTVKEEKTNE